MAATFVPDVFICNQDLWREAARQGIQCIMVMVYGSMYIRPWLIQLNRSFTYILGEIARTEISTNGPNS